MLCFCIIIVSLLSFDATYAIHSISSREFNGEQLYEFAPNTDQIKINFEFDNIAECISDFGKSCVCFETSLTPFKSAACPSNMGIFCFDWSHIYLRNYNIGKCFPVKRNKFQLNSFPNDPVKTEQEQEAELYSAFLDICLFSYEQRQHYYLLDKISLNFDVQNTKISLGLDSFILGAGSSLKTSTSGFKIYKFGFVHTSDSCGYKVNLTDTTITATPRPPPTLSTTTVSTPLSSPTIIPGYDASSKTSSPAVVQEITKSPIESGTDKSKKDGDGETAEAGSSFIYILVALIVLFVIGTCIYISSIYMAIKRKACFSKLDPPRQSRKSKSSDERQSAGADKLLGGNNNKKKKKRDPSTDQSIQHQTAAYEHDNFGNLTTDETKTNVTKEDNNKEKEKNNKKKDTTATTVSKQQQEIIELKADKKPKKPSTEPFQQQQQPPPAPGIECSLPQPSPLVTAENKPPKAAVTVKSITGGTTVQKIGDEKQPPSAISKPQPVSVGGGSKESMQNNESEIHVKAILPQQSSTAAADDVPSNMLSDFDSEWYRTCKEQKLTCCELIRQGKLRKKRPGLFCVLIVSTVIYIIFVLCLIGLGVLTGLLL